MSVDQKDDAYHCALRDMRLVETVTRVASLALIGTLGFLALVLCPFIH